MDPLRSGILAAGNFIVDYVKIVDQYPQQDMLANILRETQSNGGGPYNVLKNLAAMQDLYPLEAVGLVGDDVNGRWIREDCQAHHINTSQLHQTSERSTSYTDAMTVQSTGHRTFFHQRGANALFDIGHCDVSLTRCRILHLGYLMLLDSLDELDSQGRTRASILLERAQQAGLETSVDMVSTENSQFREIALSSLPFTDHLMINEIEASRVLSRTLDASDFGALLAAAAELIELGVRSSVTLHVEHGAVSCTRSGETHLQRSLDLPANYSQGATGAGDAFAAGLLHGLHEGWSLPDRLRLAVCTAAASLSHPSPSGGIMTVDACLSLAGTYEFRKE